MGAQLASDPIRQFLIRAPLDDGEALALQGFCDAVGIGVGVEPRDGRRRDIRHIEQGEGDRRIPRNLHLTVQIRRPWGPRSPLAMRA